ncbi:hypothetical protein [Agaribacter marinus]|uniref:Membrane protein YobI n=1 Tax=Agaribacter marinus TaxID=1431249 RepID=A0AA37T3W2_9ALTE|nr:hypothetical protein [Agaribacter marinus]GLR71020.1 putative membrane protein YobI [Agaribacter marinus]
MEEKNKSKNLFIDLAPVSRNLKDSIYQKAFDFCIGQKGINNIALTGPYGSGKSSILRGITEERESSHANTTLEISLASFESETEPSDAQIELSILQQMIYSSSSDKLQSSRFKRIRTPKQPTIVAWLVFLWLLGLLIAFSHWKEIFSLPMWTTEFWMAFLLILSVVLGTRGLIESIYKAFFGIPLKKISLKNLELEKSEDESSILNKYLDEILYFFEQTNYNLVVFEDIDRFNSPSIFIKLRELNTLINQNEDINSKRQIQFLYALKDSMFSERERTKFFEFIIPVIPIIGLSNSSDLIKKRVIAIPGLEQKLDTSFIRDVSEFLNDARLLNNIFNEFLIYLEEINDQNLNVNSLLATMIYKNVYGIDFEALHDSQGVLFNIVNQQNALIQRKKESLREKVQIIKNRIIAANLSNARSEKELVSAFVGTIIKSAIQPSIAVHVEGKHITFSGMKLAKDLEPLKSVSTIYTTDSPNRQPGWSTGKSFNDIEKEIDPEYSFEERLKQINDRTAEQKTLLQRKIIILEKEIIQAEGLPLHHLLKNNPQLIDSCIQNEKLNTKLFQEDLGLFRFLLFSGYLGEHYYLYTSIFREDDNWSANDRRFFTTLKGRLTPEIDMPLDNPKEVCDRLQLSDFSDKYILNLDLFEYLLGYDNVDLKYLDLVLSCLVEYYESAYGESFMLQYLLNKPNHKRFFEVLIEHWPDYLKTCLFSNNSDFEISKLLDCVDYLTIKEQEGLKYLIKHIERSTAAIFSNSESPAPSSNSYELLKSLQVKISNLTSVDTNSDLINFTIEESLYEINLNNILYILGRKGINSQEARNSTLSMIMKNNHHALSIYIRENEAEYVEKVMLDNPDNTQETKDTIKSLLRSDKLSTELIKNVISHQDYIFKSLEELSEHLWAHVLRTNKISPTWQTMYQCYKSKITANENIDIYLDVKANSEKLATLDYNLDSFEIEFRQYIFNNSNINDESYIQLNTKIGGDWTNFPSEISEEKNCC